MNSRSSFHSSVTESLIAGGLLLWASGAWDARAQEAPAPPVALDPSRRAERNLEYLQAHTDTLGQVRPDLWLQGINQTKRMKIVASIPSPASPVGFTPAAAAVVGVQWTQIGPAPLRVDARQDVFGTGPDSGEVTDIAIDPRGSSDQIIYIATNDGGIWKSTDGGLTWAPKTDYMPSLSMGAVALDPSNPSIVYAGTGNPFDGACVIFSGIGIYKSIDAGATWTASNPTTFASPKGIFTGVGINRIAVLPSGPLLIATSTGKGNCGALSAGLFRSVNGGLSFGTAPGFNNGQPVLNGDITDLDVDTATPTTVYASVNGQGIFVSTDGGMTFGAASLLNNTGGPAAGSFLRVTLAQPAPPNNMTLYALVQTTAGNRANLYRSTDGGNNWTPLPDATNRSAENGTTPGCQCNYDMTLGVDPQNPARVYIGFQELYASTDSGANFPTPAISRGLIHWDHHAIAFSPQAHWAGPITRLWVGTDGGIDSSINGGGAWVSFNTNIATHLFNWIDIGRGSAANNGFTYGGLQDLGTVEHRPCPCPPGFLGTDWHVSVDGDGQGVAVDPADPMIAYGCSNGGYIRTANGGGGWAGASLPAVPTPPPSAWRIVVDPNNPNNVFVVTSSNSGFCPGFNLYRSTDRGLNYVNIMMFPPGVRAIANVQIDSNVLWVGLNDGTLQYTLNALAATPTWTPVSLPVPPVGAVTGIAIDPLNTDQVVAVFQGFCAANCAAGTRTRHVFRTVNRGVMWNDISGTDNGDPTQNLPDLPVHSVVIDAGTSPHSIIIANDTKVLRSADVGATWQVFGLGLPNVDCTSLALDSTANPPLLRVGTYGRSVFELTAATGPLLAVNGDLAFGDTCVGDGPTRILQLFNVGSSDLHISSIIRVSGSPFFTISSGPATPVVIHPGEEIDYTIRFRPKMVGDFTATFQINSDDLFTPAFLVAASGTGRLGSLDTLIADGGSFGQVCVGDFHDLPLTLNNSSPCDLILSNITSSSDQFLIASVMSFPLLIHGGVSLVVPIRFEPTSPGFKMAEIVILSNDPDNNKKTNTVMGTASTGNIRVTGSTDFGDVCAGDLAEKTVSICNVGLCDLHVTNVYVTNLVTMQPCPDFRLVNNPFPAAVSHDFCVNVVIRFTPTNCGPKTCTLIIQSDDPNRPIYMLTLTANSPCSEIDVPPDLGFLPEVIQSLGTCTTQQPFPISNKGKCNLTIVAVTIGGVNAGDFALSGLPSFPIILEPGHIVGEGDLNVVFAPTVLDRNRQATITVTYLTDPNSGATASVSRKLCGEGVHTGARVLVTQAGVPLANVERIHLQRINANRNRPRLDTQDQVMDAPLVTVVPAAPCEPFQYHREYGTVSNPIQLLPGSYQVTATATINGKRKTLVVGFDVQTCDFNPTVVVDF